MWIGTHHSGRLYFRVALNEDGSAVEEADFHHAEENARRSNDHLVRFVVVPSG